VHCQKNFRRFIGRWRGRLVHDDESRYREDGFAPAVAPFLRGLFRGDRREFFVRRWSVSAKTDAAVRAALEVYAEEASSFGLEVEVRESPEAGRAAVGVLRQGARHTEERIVLAAGEKAGGAWELCDGRLRALRQYGGGGEPLFFQFSQACFDFHGRAFSRYLAAATRCLSEGRPDEAAEIAEELVRFFPHDPASWISLGGAGGERAIEAYRKALKLDSGNTAAAVLLGGLLLAEGDFAGARSCVERLLRIKPLILPARLVQMKALLKLGRRTGEESR